MKKEEELNSILLSELLSENGYELITKPRVIMHYERMEDSDKPQPIVIAYMNIKNTKTGQERELTLYPKHLHHNYESSLWYEMEFPRIMFDDLYVSVSWKDSLPIVRWEKVFNNDISLVSSGDKVSEDV